MMTAREFTYKAEAMSKAAARYEQIHAALKWLEEHGNVHDIKPTFSGHSASACAGYRELTELLGEFVSNRMQPLLTEFKQLANEQLCDLDRKYG